MSQNKDILITLGYSLDGSVTLPVNRESHRNRRIRFSSVNYENTSVLIESDFMGFNLVRYSGRIYAVPISAGKVQLEKLSEKKRAVIISASSASEIKQLLQLRDDIDGFSVSLSKDVLAEREIRGQEIGALAEKQTKNKIQIIPNRQQL